MSVVIRDAVDSDRSALVAFMTSLQAFEQSLCENRADANEAAAAHLDHLLGLVAQCGGFVLISELGGRPIGFLVGTTDGPPEGDRHIREEMRKVGYVSDIYIEPEQRGQGIAQGLLAVAESRFRAMGLPAMEICFLAANDGARRAYEAFGFEPYEVLYSKPLN